ncbi:hypothetical protein EVAR_95129_1 [Eumeta japonica]|uniref:Uncharacterized protein n=1 Tax=Eumeta variegata TaxID=151549 RepID=A0A4C1W7C0_EUMVA|nr:hypothetical protein EVAR_95129_1 [Eumeta japonica]
MWLLSGNELKKTGVLPMSKFQDIWGSKVPGSFLNTGGSTEESTKTNEKTCFMPRSLFKPSAPARHRWSLDVT